MARMWGIGGEFCGLSLGYIDGWTIGFYMGRLVIAASVVDYRDPTWKTYSSDGEGVFHHFLNLSFGRDNADGGGILHLILWLFLFRAGWAAKSKKEEPWPEPPAPGERSGLVDVMYAAALDEAEPPPPSGDVTMKCEVVVEGVDPVTGEITTGPPRPVIQMMPAPTDKSRVETGPIQFGDDWPGVFIRGDNAAYYGLTLSHVLPELTGIERVQLDGLRQLLAGCVIGPAGTMLRGDLPPEGGAH